MEHVVIITLLHSILKWIGSFLGNRMQQVVLDGESSSKLPVVNGVPQGYVLGPLLFLEHVVIITLLHCALFILALLKNRI
jgi:hypothetical protein